ncbi:hypothetical protein TrCOL_g10885 [Triparma columacea]|nr:hypothetical protein TrCOL_g10885 [Triparma columacea]
MVKKGSKTEKVEEREEERAFSESDVGRRVRVIWNVDEAYEGNVEMFNHENGQAHVLYDDGDEEWLNPEDPDTKYEFLSEKKLRKRDPKGQYARVDSGELKHFTCIDDPYEEPLEPESLRGRRGEERMWSSGRSRCDDDEWQEGDDDSTDESSDKEGHFKLSPRNPQCPHCFKTFKSQGGLAYHVSQAVCIQRQKRQELSKKERKRAPSAHDKEDENEEGHSRGEKK